MSDKQEKKLDLRSMSVSEAKKDQLRILFPEIFTENKIDFEYFKQVLGEQIETGKERYGTTWAGKKNCFKSIQDPSVGTLKTCREHSLNFDQSENVLIEGDNLEVLKLLQKAYYGKVSMIYIDPPYNTGNDFIYPDDFSESLETYLKYTEQLDNEGKRISTNPETDGRFHSKWMNMMYPRLYLAKNLLSEDGTIFISINDKEICNLKKICDEIFGEETFIAQFIWKSRQNKDNRNLTGVSIDHEYVLCYGQKLRGDERKLDQYKNPDNDPRGLWTSANMVGQLPANLRPNLHYDLVHPQSGNNFGRPDMGWRYDKNTMGKLISENKILWPENPQGRPRRKLFLSELKDETTGYSSIIGKDIYTRSGTQEIEELFGARVFDFPKPVELIKELILQGSPEDGIILDFFAGSGTTAHAVHAVNMEKKSSRKFICIQLPEKIDRESISGQAGYKLISSLACERIKKVFLKDAADNLAPSDGFKFFKLQKSNFKIWDGGQGSSINESLSLFVEHIDQASNPEDIMYEILIKSGFGLTTKIAKESLSGKEAFSIEGGAMFVCLDENITKELVSEVAERMPSRFICLDHAFHQNDQLKTNTFQLMKSRNIEFRTV